MLHRILHALDSLGGDLLLGLALIAATIAIGWVAIHGGAALI